MSTTIENPILRGFNPDPSILRVGEDYYIATSTFEWYPGVQIHHSRDLVRWELVARPLDQARLLDMLGDPDSGGIWAPCLTHKDGLFHLVYTDVKRYGRTTPSGGSGPAAHKDLYNYVVTAPAITGPWSDPVFLNSDGFDPSLFHDDDGRSYLLNMVLDPRPGHVHFAGILLQEYSTSGRRLVGPRVMIFRGTALGRTEGPHLYKRGGYYYLLTAEGGTNWTHAVTLARSRSLTGPYELHPDTYILSSRTRPDARLQRAGHASLVETPQGETWMVYLCGRPLPNRGRCVLGRETAIQRMVWGADGWLRTEDGSGMPQERITLRGASAHGSVHAGERHEFDSPDLPLCFQWLRSPHPEELFSLAARPGWLRIFGRESLGSPFRQGLVARRQQDFCYSAATALEFEPESFQQAAGLVCYYNAIKYHYLYVSHDEALGRHIGVRSHDPEKGEEYAPLIAIPATGKVHLRVEVDYERLQFAYSLDGKTWSWLGEPLDASLLSDEAGSALQGNFTGAFVGLCCQDATGRGFPADFDFFSYRERELIEKMQVAG